MTIQLMVSMVWALSVIDSSSVFGRPREHRRYAISGTQIAAMDNCWAKLCVLLRRESRRTKIAGY